MLPDHQVSFVIRPSSLNNLLSKSARNLLGGIIFFSTLLLFANVVMRYVFLAPIYWAEELARYLMVWLIFLGAGVVAGGEEHISINIVTRVLSPKGNTLLTRVIALICLLFSAALVYYSWRHTMRVRLAGQTTAALDLPMWWAYLAIPVGSAMMTLQYTWQLIHRPEPTITLRDDLTR